MQRVSRLSRLLGCSVESLGFTAQFSRGLATGGDMLKARVAEQIPGEQARLKALKAAAKVELGPCTVGMAIGGMRSMPGMVWNCSDLDKDEGIRFRGKTIPQCQAELPKAPGGSEPLPEGLFWLLMTGEVPTAAQVANLSSEWKRRSKVPKYVFDVLAALPKGTHPMTQLTIGVMALQKESVFAAAYQKGIHKSLYWDPVYEDTMDLIAKLPEVAAAIYTNTYLHGQRIAPDAKLDWAANYAHMMGHDSEAVREMMRMYLTIHSDHEGGNVSAHTTHLVGSALSDPYLCFAAGMNGLAGPLHGLANQEVLRWLMEVKAELGAKPAREDVEKFIRKTLAEGKVIPGYGHAVLRKTDPRYMCQQEFATKHFPADPLFGLVKMIYDIAPGVLGELGKVQNPFPNVDAHSGVLLQYYGIKEDNYYTVMFGVSRALGVLAQGVWSRALGLPIERPKSLTFDWLENKVKAAAK